jgi:hypothetical protein
LTATYDFALFTAPKQLFPSPARDPVKAELGFQRSNSLTMGLGANGITCDRGEIRGDKTDLVDCDGCAAEELSESKRQRD